MALSGSQITRIGVLGSPGIAYSGFTAKAEAILNEITDGIVSAMTADGFGITGLIDSDAGGILSTIEDSGIISPLDSYGGYALSIMNSDGDGITSTM